MNEPTPVLFVGGPEDGKRVMRYHLTPRIEVALRTESPTYVHPNDPVDVAVRRFEYSVRQMPGGQYVATPSDWNNDPQRSSWEVLLTALMRGYVGRP